MNKQARCRARVCCRRCPKSSRRRVLALADCCAIAFGAGPGSFTGLRTATGAAQGLAFGSDLPVVPVGTLMACAEAARARDAAAACVLVAMDARMDEAYWAVYEWSSEDDEWQIVSAPALDRPEAIPAPEQPFTLAGNAHAVFGERLRAASSRPARSMRLRCRTRDGRRAGLAGLAAR